MSEEQSAQSVRTKEQVDQEYSSICMQLGDKYYKIRILQAELQHLEQRQRELNEEATALLKQASQEQ